MDVAKRLDFDPTDTLNGLQEAAQQRFNTANMAALQELQQAVQLLSAASKQKHAQIMELARQTAEQGIGDNDLKRLQRQFDSNKATFVNIDQKQRFMKGLWDLDLDINHLTTIKDDQELRLEQASEALRTTKADNQQARQRLSNTCGSISQMYSFVEQATEATAAQLESTQQVLQQYAAKQPAAAALQLEPGPGQAEAQQLVEAETAQARELERSIAAAETLLLELESKAAAERHQLSALRAEVELLNELTANRAKAADADKHIKDAAHWCDQLQELLSHMCGVSLLQVTDSSLTLGFMIRVPTSLQDSDTCEMREVHHELTLWLKGPGDPLESGLDSMYVTKVKMTPSCVDVTDIVLDNEGSEEDYVRMVREVRGHLLSYWQRRVLIEAAAQAYPPTSPARGPTHIRAVLGKKAEAEVCVPLSWPSEPSDTLQLVELAAPELSMAAAQHIMDRVNADAALLSSCDVLSLLQHVSEAVETHIIEVAASI